MFGAGLKLPEQKEIRPAIDLISPFLALPGLVGFWPMSSVQRSTGNVWCMSSQPLHLVYNGNPTYNYYNEFVPYIDLDGTGDSLSRADEPDLDILGTETIYASAVRGLTFGGWCWWDVAGTPGVTTRPFITKERTTTFAPYEITMEDAATQRLYARFSDSNAGTNTAQPITSSPVSLQAWHCVIARFIPGSATGAVLFVDGGYYVASTVAMASLYNSTGNFEIGAGVGAAQFLDGRVSLSFLCANMLSNNLLDSLFQQTRWAFGV